MIFTFFHAKFILFFQPLFCQSALSHPAFCPMLFPTKMQEEIIFPTKQGKRKEYKLKAYCLFIWDKQAIL